MRHDQSSRRGTPASTAATVTVVDRHFDRECLSTILFHGVVSTGAETPEMAR